MEPFLDRDLVTFLIGGLGAGKTELALNLAIRHARRLGPGRSVLLDLDIINPFFRVRKVRDDLERAGVLLVCPDARVQHGDLPALPAAVWAAFETPDTSIVCDVGGGDLGLRPLARLKDLAARRRVNVLCLLNPYRPGFQTTPQMLTALRQYADLSALTITHVVPNPNLAGETTPEIFREGFERVREAAGRAGLPVPFGLMASELAATLGPALSPSPEADGTGFSNWGAIPVFVMHRFWGNPWQIGSGVPDPAETGPGVPAAPWQGNGI